jgi:hypothetical protein
VASIAGSGSIALANDGCDRFIKGKASILQ